MWDWLAACRVGPADMEALLQREGGITLTSAPVSTRKRKLLDRSFTINKRHGVEPLVLVAVSTSVRRFPTRNMASGICGPWYHIYYGTNIGPCLFEGRCYWNGVGVGNAVSWSWSEKGV